MLYAFIGRWQNVNRMKRIYISGKITGLPINEAENNFKKATEHLQKKYEGIEVVNPMKEIPYEKVN